MPKGAFTLNFFANLFFLMIRLSLNTTISHIFYDFLYFFLFFSFFGKKERLNTKLKTEKEYLNKVEVEVNNVK